MTISSFPASSHREWQCETRDYPTKMMITTYHRLSPGRRILVRKMQEINFGRIERLELKNGDPIFDPTPKIVREVKFGGENERRPEINGPDFAIKPQFLALFGQMDVISTGQIARVEIKHGLPFRMFVEG